MTDTICIAKAMTDRNIVNISSTRGLEMLNVISGGIAIGKANNTLPINTPAIKESGYFPRLTLKRTAYPFLKDDKDSFCTLHIECSLPKLLFGNNIEELSYSDLDDALLVLQDKMQKMGVSYTLQELKNAHVSRVDFGKNVITNKEPRDIIELYSKISYDSRVGKIAKGYTNGGTSMSFLTDGYRILIYDKIAEIKKSLKGGKGRTFEIDNECQASLIQRLSENNVKIIRYEVSLKRKQLKEYGIRTLNEAFLPGVAKRIFLDKTGKINNQLPTLQLDKNDLSFNINRIKTAFPNESLNRIMSIESKMRVVTEKGYDYLKDQFKLNSKQISIIKKEIKAVNDVSGCEYITPDGMQQEITRILNVLSTFEAIRLQDNFKSN